MYDLLKYAFASVTSLVQTPLLAKDRILNNARLKIRDLPSSFMIKLGMVNLISRLFQEAVVYF